MPSSRFGYDENASIPAPTIYTEGYIAGGNASTEQLTLAMEGPFTGILPCYDTHECRRFTNLEGSGIMFDTDWNTWRYLMGKDSDHRDRARRHILGWNAKAVAALAGLTRDGVEEAHSTVHHAARDEWLATHGWRHFGREFMPINIWINDLVGAIGAAVGSYGYILTAIAAVVDPILRNQERVIEKATERKELRERAYAWLVAKGLPIPENQDTEWLINYVSTLQALDNLLSDQGGIPRRAWTLEEAQQAIVQLENPPIQPPPVVIIVDDQGNQETAPVDEGTPAPGDLETSADTIPATVAQPLQATQPSAGAVVIVLALALGFWFWG